MVSVLLLVVIALGVWRVAFVNVDVPQIAWSQVKLTIASLGGSLRILTGKSDTAVTADTAAATPKPPSDAPVPMLVNAANPVPEGYAPSDLVRMHTYCDPDVVTLKESEIDGNRTAVDALMVMLRAAVAEGVGNWQISAGYRSFAYQQQIWDEKAAEYEQQGFLGDEAQSATARRVAKPGSSEHHTGLAFDVTVPGESFPQTKQCAWLFENCWEYGFIIRYTEEKESITGIAAEAWHIRYVGQPHARVMRENNWCLEEYIAALASG